MLIQACLNGSRRPGEHPALPLTPEQIAADAAAVMRAGAAAIHVHPRLPTGQETYDARTVETVVTAVREACPGLAVSVSTAAWIEPDPEQRLRLIAGWSVLPDQASVNLGEAGALELIDLLNERGVGVEAGVWNEHDARLLVDAGIDGACERVLVEVEAEPDPHRAVQLAASIDALLDDGLSEAPRLHHGGGIATWSVIAAAMEKGHDVRVGLEDTLVSPDGALADGNESLLRAAHQMARRAGRAVGPF